MLVVGRAANMANPATGKATDAERCQRGAGWCELIWLCDRQGTGTGRQ